MRAITAYGPYGVRAPKPIDATQRANRTASDIMTAILLWSWLETVYDSFNAFSDVLYRCQPSRT
jgi:hypothetical protein